MRITILILLWFLCGNIAAQTLTAHAGSDFSQPDSIPFTLLNGSATGGTPPYTYAWRTLTKPNGNDWCANIRNRTSASVQVLMTGIWSSPFGTNYSYELKVTDAVSAVAKDTIIVTVTQSAPAPAQSTGSNGFHYVTSSDSLAHPEMSPFRKDVWVDGANTDHYGNGATKNITSDIRNKFSVHNDTRVWYEGSTTGQEYFTLVLSMVSDSIFADSSHPWYIVPRGGKLEYFDTFIFLGTLKNCIITGEYNPALRIGSPLYPGHKFGNYANSAGTYGIVCNNGWRNIDHNAFDFGGLDSIRNVKISYCEGPHGGGYFMLLGNFTKTSDITDIDVCDNYGIDSRAEMYYVGRTQSDPQQTLKNIRIYNNRFVRSGLEIDQFGQNGVGCHVYNNVFYMSATNRLSPFEADQAFNSQRYVRQNGSLDENNIRVGSGQQNLSLILNKPSGLTITSDTIYYKRDLFYNCWGAKDAFIGSQNGGAYNVVFDSCFFGYRPSIYVANLVYSASSNNFMRNVYPILNDQSFTPNISYTFRHIRYDTSGGKTRLTPGGTATTTYADTAKAILNPFRPVNSGFIDNTNTANNLYRYCDTIGKTYDDEDASIPDLQQGTVWTFKKGMYCTHLGWVYVCKVDNDSHPPARIEDQYWHPLQWFKKDGSVTRTPPDDVRLFSNDPNAKMKIGLLDQYKGFTIDLIKGKRVKTTP